MTIIFFDVSIVSRTEDGSIAVAISQKQNGETQVILQCSLTAAASLALALSIELLPLMDRFRSDK